MTGTFEWRGTDLPYCDAVYNQTARNERAVEVPVAFSWLNRTDGSLLEVGNVLAHYAHLGDVPDRTVVDRYARDDAGRIDGDQGNILQVDVLDHRERYDRIVSISTIEHVGWDWPERRDERKAIRALHHLRGLLNPGGSMLVTVPLGCHPALDVHLLSGDTGADQTCTIVRDPPGAPLPEAEWHVTRDLEARPYDGRPWHGANSVWVGEWR